MGYQPHDFETEWADLEPKQPRQNRRWLWLAGLVFLLLGICVTGVFLLVQQFLDRTDVVEPPVVVPTSPIEEVVDAPTATPNLDLAPTATLNQPNAPPSPPVSPQSNVSALRLAQPPQIDGDLSEWDGTATTTSAFRVYRAEGWDGSEDLTAVWHLGWDDAHLYIAVSVTDDTHVQTQSGNQIFRGDSVDIQFDTDREGDYAPVLSPDDFQITLSPGNFADLKPSAFRFRGTSDGRILDAPGRHNISVMAQATATGYDIEAAIPWEDLELAASPDLVIGIALNANDNDTPGTAVQEVMMSHVSTRTLRDPTGWGTLTLK